MATELKVPRLGMDMEEANILRWIVEEGATVEKGEPVLEIDTDKVAFEIEANADGVIQSLRGEPGETVPVGMILAYITAPGEEVPEEPAAEVAPAGATAAAAPETPSAAAPAPAAAPERVNGAVTDRGPVRASPAARRAAAQRGISIESVSGSGPGGRIYLSDVLEADVRSAPAAPETPAAPPPAPAPAAPTTVAATDGAAAAGNVEALSRVRRVGAERTAASFRDVPHFYLTRDLQADRLLELAARMKAKMDPAPSVTDLLVLAVGRVLRDHPRLRSRYAGEGRVEWREGADVGIAVATEDGLLVPVVRGADRLPLRELVAATKDLVRRAREGRLGAEDLGGGTFTISNLGMMGVDQFDAIINAPEAAILAVGRTRTVPEWEGDGWVPRRVVSATLSIDHRVADGADGARFLMDLQDALLDWELLL